MLKRLKTCPDIAFLNAPLSRARERNAFLRAILERPTLLHLEKGDYEKKPSFDLPSSCIPG